MLIDIGQIKIIRYYCTATNGSTSNVQQNILRLHLTAIMFIINFF